MQSDRLVVLGGFVSLKLKDICFSEYDIISQFALALGMVSVIIDMGTTVIFS